jgi:chemosensory pili system protein ChpB (putative protein-glutamate methylesterase)
MPENTMTIALLSQAGESGRHLRDALAETGTAIVYESQAAEFDREALEQSGARVVVVNLDSEADAHLDDVYALLDDDRYNVIFNEAQVSSQLSGWEQARWARHLAAKILGSSDSDPPRPAGAEPVPQRVVEAPPVATMPTPESEPALASESKFPAHLDEAADEDAGLAAPTEAPTATSKPVVDDFADIALLLSESEADPLETLAPLAAAPTPAASLSNETVPMPALDLSEFDDFGEFSTADSSVDGDEFSIADESVSAVEIDDADLTVEMPALDLAGGSGGDVLGFGDLDDFADSDETLIESIEMASVEPSQAHSIEVEISESIQASEAAASGNELSDLRLLDLDWTDPPETQPGAEQPATAEVAKAPEVEPAFSWSLEDQDGEDAATAARGRDDDGSGQVEPATFGIEKISASEYLAPEAEQTAEDFVDLGMSLELIPLDEAVAPQNQGGSGANESGSESWLDTSNKVAISRVWVLGASIGGPEAVREFLADIPAKCPALFLLAQHMGAEFMEIMAQQLARSTALNVRTPTHGERVSHGDIIVVPTTHRLRVDRAGVVTLELQSASGRPNSPSIDQVLQDVADRFGKRAGAIIFSGMAEDAIEGSRYLTEIGGTVYAQDPETCVISSMVDGVIETGVVSFVGSPKALASKMLGTLNATAKS